MKCVVQAVLGVSLAVSYPVFAASKAPVAPVASVAPVAPVAPVAIADPAHVKAVQDLLEVMHVEKLLRYFAARYRSDRQRHAVFVKLDKMPQEEVYRRMAPELTNAISTDTAVEMTRFYYTAYGMRVIRKKYTTRARAITPGTKPVIPAEELQERQRPAYVQASKALAEAEPAIKKEAARLVQQISREKR